MLLFSCADKINPSPCPTGTYSGQGQDVCTDCPPGFYCPSTNSSSPIPCQPGYYANETNSLICKVCDPGYSCFNSSENPVVCDNGTYSSGSCSACIQCPSGYRLVEFNMFVIRANIFDLYKIGFHCLCSE